MILGANGQNIYPEEIEARLNNMPYVSESMIIKRKNRLVGLVFPKFEEMEQKGVMLEELRKIMIANCLEVNKKLAKYEQIDHIEVWEEEFEKTPKKTMKRYLYHEN